MLTKLKRTNKFSVLISILCLASSFVSAQSPYLRHLTSKDGLPSLTIYSMLQDDLGFIWLGTAAGICRYDGVNFEIFEIPGSLGSSIDHLQKDSQGRIFFKNFAGQIFYYENDSIQEVNLPANEAQFGGYSILSDDRMLIFKEGFYVSDPSLKSWSRLELAYTPTTKGVKKIFLVDSNSKIWFFDNQELYLTDSTISQRFHSDNPINSIQSIDSSLLILNNINREIYELTENGFNRVYENYNEHLNARITELAKDRKGRTWIYSTDGAICYENDSSLINDGLVFLKGNYISSFLNDNEGNYWFSTIGNGLFVMYDESALVYNQSNSKIFFDQVKRVSKAIDNNVIVATNGLESYMINESGHIITSFQTPEGDTECIFVDVQNNQIILELEVFNLSGGKSIRSYSGGVTPKDIKFYNKNLLAIAAGDGAYLVKNPSQQYPILNPSSQGLDAAFEGPSKILRRERTRCVYVDGSNDRIWYGFSDGLYYFDTHQPRELTDERGNPIIALAFVEGENGTFWVSTIRNGLYQIKDTSIVHHITTENGLVSNFCRTIKSEGEYLYIGTNKGLQVLNLKDNTSRFFNEQDGLPTNEITDLAITDHKIWISTLKGLVSLNHDFNGINLTPPQIYIKDFKVVGVSQEKRDAMSFPYDKNNVSFKLTGISHRSEGKFSYFYRLLGVDDQWREASSSNNEVNFFTLPPGDYMFEAYVLNEDGISSENTVSWSFSISKPFWQTWWFISAIALLLMLSVSTIFVLRIRAINRRNKLEKDLQAASLAVLNLQMNPHFVFNALASIQNYILQSNTKESVSYLAKFGKLMRQVLEHSRKEFITIEEEIEMLSNYLEIQQLRFQNTFDYSIEVDQHLDPKTTSIPPLLTQPFVENSIEHGFKGIEHQGVIKINFVNVTKSMLLLEIIDNGIGLRTNQKNTKEHNSLATQITKERLALMRSRFKEDFSLTIADCDQDKGTIVSVNIPVQY